MALALAKHVSFCRIDDRLIFLDVANDRYFAARCPRAASLDAGFPASLAATLKSQGLLVDSLDGETSLPEPLRRATSSLLDDGEARPMRRLAGQAVFAMLVSLVRLRTVRLAPLLQGVRERSADAMPQDRPTLPLRSLIASFVAARRWLPIGPRCLPDSLALMQFLHRHGYRPTLVFGVIAYPFAAHCWLQDGDAILNDAFDHAQRFTPILEV